MGHGRSPPVPRPPKRGDRSIFLADYNGPQHIDGVDAVRLHPVRKTYDEPLNEALQPYAVAKGYTTTALVTAALEGLRVVCLEGTHILNNEDWLDLLPYADWTLAEIATGEAWEHLSWKLRT